jgi:peptidase M23-like protein
VMSHHRFVIVIVLLLTTFTTPSAQPAGAPVEIRSPFAPVAVAGTDGLVHVAYELHVTNFHLDTGTLRLERVEIFADQDPLPVTSYDGSDLDTRVLHSGAEASLRYGRSIAGGLRVIVYLWVTLQPRQATVRSLRHRLVFQGEKGVETVGSVSVDVLHTPVVIGTPLRGGIWITHNGPGNHQSPHWRSNLAWNGRVTIPQRFAIDFLGLDTNGNAVRGDFRKSANEDWEGFGVEVVAVADGVVRDMQDGIADNLPLVEPPPPAEPTAAAGYGNFVILEVQSKTFVHYAHLQRGSVSVKVGQRVRRGQVLGRLGNSGNNNAPALHFSVNDSVSFEGSEGLPFLFDAFELLGETTAERAVGAEASPGPLTLSPVRRRRELPLNGTVLRFQ